MNILAIDYGAKKMGLAWVNEDLGVVLPYGVLANDESQKQNAELLALIASEKVEKIVIGLPLGLDSEENKNTKKIRAFAAQLSQDSGLPVEFADERYTSYEADSMGGVASRDEKSAMIILQSYLADQS